VTASAVRTPGDSQFRAVEIGGGRETGVRFMQAIIVGLVVGWPVLAAAQQPPASPPPPPSARPFEIVDNSFLVEEAYNQEPRIFQNIFGAVRSDGGEWAASFTQEWPAPGMRHQLSYTLVFDNDSGAGRIGDVGLNYRFQLRSGENGSTALAPRVSLLLRPDRRHSAEAGRVGVELNLPASRQLGDVFVHGNAGVRIYPAVATNVFPSAIGLRRAHDVALVSPFLAGSAILRVRPMLHLMLESVVLFRESVMAPGATDRSTSVILSPGTRFGWNIGDHQIVLGVAVPVERSSGETRPGLFGYSSWELPFQH
jgi:hypothetical protein